MRTRSRSGKLVGKLFNCYTFQRYRIDQTSWQVKIEVMNIVNTYQNKKIKYKVK